MIICVGSNNPVKIEAVKVATRQFWPGALILGYSVESFVSAQPMSDQETQLGAENRAQAAFQLGSAELSSTERQECIAIGMEGGVFEHINGELWNTVWVSVTDQTFQVISVNGERFRLPQILADRIRAGKEMGPAMDELIGSTNIKQKEGMIGVITKQFINRTQLYAGLAQLALGLWHGREWETELLTK